MIRVENPRRQETNKLCLCFCLCPLPSIIIPPKKTAILHAETHAATTLSIRSLTLHLLANLDIDLEEFGDAAV